MLISRPGISVPGITLAGRYSSSGVLTFATTRPRRRNASGKEISSSRIMYDGLRPSVVGRVFIVWAMAVVFLFELDTYFLDSEVCARSSRLLGFDFATAGEGVEATLQSSIERVVVVNEGRENKETVEAGGGAAWSVGCCLKRIG